MHNLIKLSALLVIAAVGAFVIRGLFIAASEAETSTAAAVRVRAAAEDLPGGLLLREADLVWKEIPRDQLPPGALVQEQASGARADLKGYLLRHAVRAGTPLGPADVISPTAPGFLAAALKPDMRAISVAVNDVSGNAGLIQPGDYVDILLTQQMRAEAGMAVPPSRMVESETVAERVRVLAVGSVISRPKDDAAAPHSNARTVTFEVTPHGAQVIAVAAYLGSLSLALRSFAMEARNAPDAANAGQERAPPVWAGDVSRALRSMAPPVPAVRPDKRPSVPQAPQVVIYRGSKADQPHGPPAGNATGSPAASPSPAPSTPLSSPPPAAG